MSPRGVRPAGAPPALRGWGAGGQKQGGGDAGGAAGAKKKAGGAGGLLPPSPACLFYRSSAAAQAIFLSVMAVFSNRGFSPRTTASVTTYLVLASMSGSSNWMSSMTSSTML